MGFSFVFSPIFENLTFIQIPQFWRKVFLGYFKSQISKWKNMSELLSVTRGLKVSYISKIIRVKISSCIKDSNYDILDIDLVERKSIGSHLNLTM